jgi:ABC-type branched-subunit amino acid transport system substrate-binding protein
MKRYFFIFIIFIMTTGCVSSGSQWERYSYNNPAEAAPKPLSADEHSNNESPIYHEAGLEYWQNRDNTNRHRATVEEVSPHDPSYGEIKWMNRPQYSDYQSGNQRYRTNNVRIEKVKVALLVPLSGKHKHLGQSMLQSAQMALFDMKYDNFVLIPRDTRATTEGAVEAAQSAINEGVELIIGPLFSSSVRAIKPITAKARINMLAFSTDWSLADKNTFIMGFLPFAQVQRVTAYALESGIENIAILAPNTDYGNAVIASYNSLAYRLDMNIADVVRFPPDEKDISSIIRVMAKYDERVEERNELVANIEENLEYFPEDEILMARLEELKNIDTWGDLPFDAILLPVGGEKARSIANLLSFYDLGPEQVKRLGTGLWDEQGLATEPSMEGAWFAAPSPKLRKGFEKRYREIFSTAPPRLSSLAYDATALAVLLARTGHKNRGVADFQRDAFINPNGFSGIDGIFRFRSDGLIERGLAVMEMKKKNVKVLDEAPMTFQRPVMHQTTHRREDNIR